MEKHVSLPDVIDEPMYWINDGEENAKFARSKGLEPGWLPAATVSRALGYGDKAVLAAQERFGPYCWCSEFENVHSTWRVSTVPFEHAGVLWKGSEQLFQALKLRNAFEAKKEEFAHLSELEAYSRGRAVALDVKWWDSFKDDAMRQVLRLKFEADPFLMRLLLSTGKHPLVSVKHDAYWGAGLDGKGDNKLGQLLMELRNSKA